MFVSKRLLIAGIAVAALASGGAQSAFAQSPGVVGEIANNEGIFVDAKSFKIAKGTAKGDPSAQIAKLGAKEVGPGAIIFRSGDKLYMVEGRPPSTSGQYFNSPNFQDTIKFLKDFQDNWNTSYVVQ